MKNCNCKQIKNDLLKEQTKRKDEGKKRTSLYKHKRVLFIKKYLSLKGSSKKNPRDSFGLIFIYLSYQLSRSIKPH